MTDAADPSPDADAPPPMQAAIVPVTPLQQNCSLVWETATMRGAVIDPGGDVERLLAAAEETGCVLEKILLTHAHADHAGGVSQLVDRLGLPIEGPHEADRFWIARIAEDAAKWGIGDAAPFTPARWLVDEDTVTVGENQVMRVRHCPGHTPGHVVFVHEGMRLAFVGDVLFKGSVGRSDFPKGDGAELVRSIRDKLFPLGDDIVFVPGHGPLSTFGDERRTNPFVRDR